MKSTRDIPYSPLSFLSALGNGGLSVSFFMYLMFMLKHPDTPIPTFDHIAAAFRSGSAPTAILVAGALGAILYFAFRHFLLLGRNIVSYLRFKRTEAYARLTSGEAESSLLAAPLAFGMSVNVLFILGALFVPGLWSRVEYLFPFSLAAFAAVGFFVLRRFVSFHGRLIASGGIGRGENNSFGHLIAPFAFSMVAVGFAAAGAMSRIVPTSAVGILGALFFSVAALVSAAPHAAAALRDIAERGISREGAPTVLVGIPIATLLGITLVRVVSGFAHNLSHGVPAPTAFLLPLGALVSFQVLVAAVGIPALRRIGYFRDYVFGPQLHAGSFALICPGVAFFVLGMFFVHQGLVRSGLLAPFSPAYFAALLTFIAVQTATVAVLAAIERKFGGRELSHRVRRPRGEDLDRVAEHHAGSLGRPFTAEGLERVDQDRRHHVVGQESSREPG